MKSNDIARLRLKSQQLTSKNFNSPAELVHYIGAMQAQDFAMVKWAIGQRLPKSSESEIDKALDNGDILRTHLLRPTWHIVAAEDIHWMLELTAPQILKLAKLRLKQLELTPEVLSKSRMVLEAILTANDGCNRDVLRTELEKAGIATNEQRLSYILENAELQKLICSGKSDGRKPTYALLDHRVPVKKIFPREEALAKLALRYFNSHGPATLKDFIWWSGMNVSDARAGLEAVKTQLSFEEIKGKSYYFSSSLSPDSEGKSSLLLIPAFDEYFISYADRSAVISKEHHSKAASNNGIFWPIIVQNGKIKGTWKRTIKADKVIVQTSFFGSPSDTALKQVQHQGKAFGKFLKRKAVWIDR